MITIVRHPPPPPPSVVLGPLFLNTRGLVCCQAVMCSNTIIGFKSPHTIESLVLMYDIYVALFRKRDIVLCCAENVFFLGFSCCVREHAVWYDFLEEATSPPPVCSECLMRYCPGCCVRVK